MNIEDMEERINHALRVLNRIHRSDPSVLQALIYQRVPCNEELASDPEVQVGEVEPVSGVKQYEVGLLGIINGIVGVHNTGWGYICANIDELDGRILGFSRSEQTIT